MRPVDGWPGYLVDEEGRVYTTFRRGRGWDQDPTELVQFDRRTIKKRASPYLSVNLSRRNGGGSLNRFVHEIVCIAFHGPRPPGAVVCHGPGGSRDNRAANLRWDTVEANNAERVLCSGDAWHETHGHAFSDLVGGQ